MTPTALEAYARESLRMSHEHGWDRHQAVDHAAGCLVALGMHRKEAEALAGRVWDRHFDTMPPV
jgi:hypothetical protein